MTKIRLHKTYVATRCRAVMRKIEDMRNAAVRTAFEAKIHEFYGWTWLDFPTNLIAATKRIRAGWPNEEPIGTDEEIDEFVSGMTVEQRAETAYLFKEQYGICLTLLHAATIDESEPFIELGLDDYECIADANHEARREVAHAR